MSTFPAGPTDAAGRDSCPADDTTSRADPPSEAAETTALAAKGSTVRQRMSVGVLPDLGPPQFRRSTSRSRRSRRSRRRRRLLGWAMAASAALLLLSTAWVAWQAYQVYRGLDAAAAAVDRALDSFSPAAAEDARTALHLIGQARESTSAAVTAADDPVYRIATGLPLIGPNLDAAGEMARGLDDLLNAAQQAVPALVAGRGSLDEGLDGPGVAELVAEALPVVQELRAAADRAAQRLADLDPSALVEPVAAATTDLTARLADLQADLTTVDSWLKIVDLVLGVTQDRRVLVGLQNSAELRATGGILGSFIVLQTRDGTVDIVEQGSTSRDWAAFTEPVAPVPDEVAALFGQLPALYPQDVNLTPDFPTAASLLAAMYRARGGRGVDAVVVMDPAVLSGLLPTDQIFDLGDDLAVDAAGLPALLLAGIYDRFPATADQPARDRVLSTAVGTLLEVVLEGPLDPAALQQGLSTMIDQDRILVWASDPELQAVVAATPLSGGVTGGSDIGVFLNDASGSKLGFHQYHSLRLEPGGCRPDGRREYRATVELEFRTPSGPLPDYVRGATRSDGPPVLTTSILVMAPTGGGIVSGVDVDGSPRGVQRGEIAGREVALVSVELGSGRSSEVSWTVVDAAGAVAGPDVRVTPAAHPWSLRLGSAPAC